MKKRTITTISSLALFSLENEALADPYFVEIIPASACQIEDEEDIGKADLVDGSWLIGSSITNTTVELICPVRIAPFFVVGGTKTDLEWWDMEMFYRDPDGMSDAHSVTATLFEVEMLDTMATPLEVLSSNQESTTSDVSITSTVSGKYQQPVDSDAVHFVRVEMKQGSNNGTDRVRFTRIRFYMAPPEE